MKSQLESYTKKWKHVVPHNKYTAPWIEEEIAIVEKNYHTLTDKELVELLPMRTPSGVRGKRLKLGLRKKKIERWSSQEKEILQKAYYTVHSLKKMKTLLSDRTLDSIYGQAHRLNLNREYSSHLKTKVVRGLSDFERG